MSFISKLDRVGSSHFCLLGPQGSGYRSRFCSRLVVVSLLVFCLLSFASAQVAFPTSLADNARTAASTSETLLSPSNVNKSNFGRLFSYPIDYVAQAQPLYVPNVDIPGKGVHNVVYVVTMEDSVYAFDAENNTGDNAAPLWHVNFTDPANGITVASGAMLPCGAEGGFVEEGILSTPAIDVTPDVANSTMYLVAKTVDNGTVVHRLHALDLATGQEKFGGPTVLAATSTSHAGHVTVFNSLHQKNRPGLLLMNSIVYLGFGSNGCNDNNTGWVLAYDATTLQQTGVFNTNPDHGLTSIWQAGGGLAGDAAGNVYPLTSEGTFDLDIGGQGYTEAVLRLTGSSLELTDFFIPSAVAFINSHDLDLSGGSPVLLPDQDGLIPHVMVAAGKQGTIYVLNRDGLGLYATNDQIIQELPGVIGQARGGPAYWNGRLYFSAKGDQLKAFSVSGGMLSTAPIVKTSAKLTGAHTPAISADGNTDGIVWVINGGGLFAYRADTLGMLYNSKQNAGDTLPAVAHFATQTVANGRVYVATRNSLEVYGLRHFITLVSGGGQSATVTNPLPAPIQVQTVQGYTNTALPGIAVNFSDGGKGGTFNPPSAFTDINGVATSNYTVPKKAGTSTLTMSATGFTDVTTTATALPGAPVLILSSAGNNQTGPAGSVLPVPLTAKVQDAYANGVPGITVTFDDGGKGGVLTPTSAVTDATGKATTNYKLPNLPGTYKVNASVPSLKTMKFTETGVVGAPANVAIVSGDNQSTSVVSPLPQALAVKVTDQAGNAVSGTSVTFTAPSGSFTGNPATTDSNGNASANYTAGTVAGPVTITATAGSPSASFHETVNPGAASSVTVSGGNSQAAPAGSQLPQALTVIVADQYANPVPGVNVVFDDGGAGGFFSNGNLVVTDSSGTALEFYTLPTLAGPVTISANAAGVASPAFFSEFAQ